MQEISTEALAETARWGYRTLGRGIVVVTSDGRQYYVTSAQTCDFFGSHPELTGTDIAAEAMNCVQSYKPRTEFLVLLTVPEVVLLLGEYAGRGRTPPQP